MVADVVRRIIVLPRCPLGEVVCSDGLSCSIGRFCGMGSVAVSALLDSESSEPPGLPVIKLTGDNVIEVKQASAQVKWNNYS